MIVSTLLITWYAQGGYADDAIDLFFFTCLKMVFVPISIPSALSSMLSACTELGSVRLGQQLHSLALRHGLVVRMIIWGLLATLVSRTSFVNIDTRCIKIQLT
jgi:hypothetical protein